MTERPNIPVPAPVFMGIFLIIGYVLNRAWPMYLETGRPQFLLGWLCIALATILLLWCFRLFRQMRTTIMPRNPVASFVTSGPYRISRNPMYLSLALYHLGIAMATGNLWQALSFAPSMLAIRLWVIGPEEAYLRKRFGKDYSSYCERVRRWL